MSSHAYATPLTLYPEPSRRLRAMLLLVHAGAALWPFLVLPPLTAVALLCMVFASLHHAWSRHLGSHRITQAVWGADGEWALETADGANRSMRLAPLGYVSAYAVVLRLHNDRSTHTLVLLADSLDAESFRRLRVRLRLGSTEDAPAQDTPAKPV